jgi:hypothetical protein
MKRLPSVRGPHSMRLVPAGNLAVGDRGGRAPAECYLVGAAWKTANLWKRGSMM